MRASFRAYLRKAVSAWAKAMGMLDRSSAAGGAVQWSFSAACLDLLRRVIKLHIPRESVGV